MGGGTEGNSSWSCGSEAPLSNQLKCTLNGRTRQLINLKQQKKMQINCNAHYRYQCRSSSGSLFIFLSVPSLILIITATLLSLDLCARGAEAVWQDNIQPKIRITQLNEADVQRFSGNTTHPDHFKLLQQDGESLLVGAR